MSIHNITISGLLELRWRMRCKSPRQLDLLTMMLLVVVMMVVMLVVVLGRRPCMSHHFVGAAASPREPLRWVPASSCATRSARSLGR